jgi:hypothetical protein
MRGLHDYGLLTWWSNNNVFYYVLAFYFIGCSDGTVVILTMLVA